MKINYYAYSIVFIAGFLFLGSCRKDKIAPSQVTTFIKYFGENGNNTGGAVDQTSDGGYIFVGTSNAYGNGNQIIVQKTDKYGNAMWIQIIGGSGNDAGNFVKAMSDGGYLVVATRAEKVNTAYTDANLIKLNSDGSISFDSIYGYPDFNDLGTRAISTMDGGYILIGTSDSTKNATSDVFIVKTNSSGMTSWTGKYGNLNSMNTGTSIQQVNDSIYLTSASTLSNSGNGDMLITQGRYQFGGKSYESNSNLTKSSFSNASVNSEVNNASDLILGTTGNAFVLGDTKGDIYILNISSSESVVSFSTFGTSAIDSAAAFTQTSDGGFIIAGKTYNTSNGNSDIFIVKTDAGGNVSWMKNYGGTGNDYGSFVKQTSDGGYIVSGTVQFGGDQTGSNNVMALFKLNSGGNLE